jgi:hypothetical protein
MKKPVNELCDTFCWDEFQHLISPTRRPRARNPREATMDKTNQTFLISSTPASSAQDDTPCRPFADASFEAALYLKDKRVAQLLVLLRQLSDSAGGLGTLPRAELGEIVSSAVAVSGFLNPTEAEEVIAAVLEAFDTLPRPPICVPLE